MDWSEKNVENIKIRLALYKKGNLYHKKHNKNNSIKPYYTGGYATSLKKYSNFLIFSLTCLS